MLRPYAKVFPHMHAKRSVNEVSFCYNMHSIEASHDAGALLRLAVFLASGGFVQISLADEEADQLEAQVKSSADAYNDAILRQEELTAEIAELDARIAELEAKLPAQRERSDESIRALYKYEYDSVEHSHDAARVQERY